MAKNYTFGSSGAGELRPGVTPRRWEPECGVNKLNTKIHKESKYADTHKNLPFSFGKPLKAKVRSTAVKCNNCGKVSFGTTATVGKICSSCNTFSMITEVLNSE